MLVAISYLNLNKLNLMYLWNISNIIFIAKHVLSKLLLNIRHLKDNGKIKHAQGLPV